MPQLMTIGYEGATQAEVIEKLRAARVEVLVDVRAVASSRRAGFSKSILAASLAEAGIDYVHLRALGTPQGRARGRAQGPDRRDVPDFRGTSGNPRGPARHGAG
ncbi:DUF488 domain-containing protein [Thermohalobaculum sediminis]|uniref:DUF488 domain-containing protein n=1 Tax=Thermohalobaculum sediminis TaxID=2939436 RepID=UPI0022285A27|nr:DUF488 domain-containing protein [Limibaculum sediminis]